MLVCIAIAICLARSSWISIMSATSRS